MGSNSREEPLYLDTLSLEDTEEYHKLRNSLSGPECRNCRNKRLESFAEMLQSIKKYAVRGNDDDWKRCLVCGIAWIPDGVAINTHQLSVLLGKCKSSINGSFHRMKYVPFPCSNEASKELTTLIPQLKTNYSELRQWTMRKHVILTPQPAVDPIKIEPENSVKIEPSPIFDLEPQIEFIQEGIYLMRDQAFSTIHLLFLCLIG